MPSIDLTKDEANAMLQLFDIAIKAHGLQVADMATAMARKVAMALQDVPPSSSSAAVPKLSE